MSHNSSNPTTRSFTCGSCGTIVLENERTLDENGYEVLKCPQCGMTAKQKRIVVHPLPETLSRKPEAQFNKRPV